MKVEIWSDVMCPFCYIGKRRFESALQDFAHNGDIEVEWKSFQLNPDMVTDPGKSINEYLAEHKGWTLDYARQANSYVTEMASKEGLTYNMDKAVVANSFDAHRLLQLAKTVKKSDELEEALFHAYFTEGKNIADHEVLLQLGIDAGLPGDAVKALLDSDEFATAVDRDIYEAQQIGVRGVPYFVLNDRYAVSGAQSAETFAGALDKSWGEWRAEQTGIQELTGDGESCATDGSNCA